MTPDASPSTTQPHWSRAAIASPILGVLGFVSLGIVVGLFIAAAGAISGHLARHQLKTTPLRGKRLALLGLVASYGAMLFFPIVMTTVVLSVPAFDRWQAGRSEVQRKASESQASRLFIACEAYARANSDRYPRDWKQLKGAYLSPSEWRQLLKSPYRDGADQAFELVPHDRPVLSAVEDSVVVIQEMAPPSESEIAVVYANGSVKFLHNPRHTEP